MTLPFFFALFFWKNKRHNDLILERYTKNAGYAGG
jgi:hypothetical protein